MDSSRWTEIYEGINMHLQKAYNTNKASFKAKHWKADPTTGTYDVEVGDHGRAHPDEIQRREEMKRREATGEYTELRFNALDKRGSFVGNNSRVGRNADSKYFSDMLRSLRSGGCKRSAGVVMTRRVAMMRMAMVMISYVIY
ncbi:hypothetical protein Tco_0537841 [Tanacetum coccineum]